MRAVLPLDLADINEPEVDLIDERGRLEHVTRTLTRHVTPGEPAELLVHERQQLFDGVAVPASPLDEKGSDVAQGSAAP